ncbi:YdeI/OmpD-associated family protein [Flavobacterium sp. HXWNR69]|uniref:YdeI/OmpD-associated family protein n=1 Tax=Flavobacterium fragile TaxID=2949085 RepID=A0ABT0TG97_9FLAO|nr:YdeI/OmpD-associated family protein [Flavobacterium sp. HXWNR69]
MLEKENKWNKTNQWEYEIEQLHAIIRKTPLIETTKWGGPVYTYKNKNVLGIGGFKSYFGIWFYNGVFLKDEKKLLINANEENTKSLRQMRFNSANEIDEKLILAYIKEAIEIEEKGVAIPKEKKETIIPEILQNELDKNSELKNKFNAFSPYKQREFIEHITSAKQEKTQLVRLEKIILMILEEKGLNDKYR